MTADFDALGMANTCPNTVADLHRQLPSLELLVDEPQADHKLFSTQELSIIRRHQVVDLLQNLCRQSASLPDASDNDVDDLIALRVWIDLSAWRGLGVR